MINIWYLFHCQNQNEWKVLDVCRRNQLNGVLRDAFVFTYDRMRRYQGEWHTERRLMFPDCVFLECDDENAESLTEELGRYEGMRKLLGECGTFFFPVKKSEEMFLKSLCGKAHHLGMSKGMIRDGITQVLEGPLQGMEARIYKIDRHKRLARLVAPGSSVSGSARTKASESIGPLDILAGLEIVERI